MDNEAVGALAGNDHGTVFAALERVGFDVEAKASLLPFRPMATETTFRENRLDVLCEIDRAGGRRRQFGQVDFRRHGGDGHHSADEDWCPVFHAYIRLLCPPEFRESTALGRATIRLLGSVLQAEAAWRQIKSPPDSRLTSPSLFSRKT